MSSRSVPPVDYGLLFLLAAIWGGAFLVIKVAVATIPPWTIVAGRLVLGAAVLLAFVWLTGRRLPRDPALWRSFIVVAAVGNLIPFFLIAWGEITIDSGLAAILMATMPLTTALLAHVYTRDERLSVLRFAGVLLGLAGIVVLVGPGVIAGLGREVLAQLALTGAACCYAVASVYTRTSGLVTLPPAVSGAGVLVCAAVMSLPFSLVIDRPWTLAPSSESLWALLVLALLCTAAAYIIFFRLVAAAGATFLSLINYLIPVFGVVWGALLLGEALGLRALAALGLILVGVAFTQIRRRARDTTD